MKEWKVPGLAVAIVKDGKILVCKGYGVSELGTDKKVDKNTLFLIGSNTKAFTGTALAMLENEGKCKLTDKVKKWYPDLKMYDKNIENQLNLIDIITHRMGFSGFQGDFMNFYSGLTPKQIVEKMGQMPPKHDFRTKYGYSNSAYALAGLCIINISGMSLGRIHSN